MKKIMFLAVAMATIGYYALPVFAAKAGSDPSVQASVSGTPTTILYMRVTAYTSEVDETDSTPFITANGTYVHDGIIATNVLPFGTKVEIPALFGDKVFTVEDRMNVRMKNGVDVWMSDKGQALRFGSNYADIVVLGNGLSMSGQTVAEAKGL